jgi:hypothetical protein
MKNMKQQTPNHNMKVNLNRPRPENKDDLDSREGEEQLSKGSNITHNKKEKKNKKASFNRNKL